MTYQIIYNKTDNVMTTYTNDVNRAVSLYYSLTARGYDVSVLNLRHPIKTHCRFAHLGVDVSKKGESK